VRLSEHTHATEEPPKCKAAVDSIILACRLFLVTNAAKQGTSYQFNTTVLALPINIGASMF
jgi:hypothetical protein